MISTFRSMAIRILLAISLLACVAIGQATTSGLPVGITDSQDPGDTPLSPAESVAKMTVPDGFSVKLFASEPTIGQPIAFTFDDRGRVWLVECYSHPNWKPEGKDRVVILEDVDKDGSFDKRTVFWDQGRYLSGIAVGHGGVYLCNTPELIFIADADHDDVPDGKPEVLLDGWTHKNHNNVFNNLKFGPDGWLYGCIGNDANSLVGAPGASREIRTEINRGLWRYHPYGKKFERLASGAVNPWGLDFDDRGEAFFTNCVLPHLWHVIPGAYYQRRPKEQDNPYVYERIKPICDHLHWAGGNWIDSRGAHGEHGAKGGGHAHTGAMIYLGGAWPDEYRGTMLMGNIHGNRINQDSFERHQSGFVAHHVGDFLLGNNPWFRCLSQQYGADGQVYISDWHDLGECHDDDGSHRSSGRIYKVVWDDAKDVTIPGLGQGLHSLDNERLVELQLHENEWYVRWARKILHHRAESGQSMDAVHSALRKIYTDHESVPRKLRAMWCLYVTSGADREFLKQSLEHEDQSVRAWAVRLLLDRPNGDEAAPPSVLIDRLVKLAKSEPAGLVRLHLASSLQRIPPAQRWRLAQALSSRMEDVDDRRLQLMIWYGVEPVVPSDPDQAIELMRQSKLPIVRAHLARRLAEML